MNVTATAVRKGMVIIVENAPCKVMEFRHITPGKGNAVVQTRVRNLITGSSFDHRFRSNELVERATLEQHDMEYLYSDGSEHHFMNTESYEQVAISEDDLGDAAQWLMAGLRIKVEFYNGDPIGIELPSSLDLTVTETDPVLKGATVSNSNKPAKLENGVTVTVPPFIVEGERIRVNPTESKYLERVK
ncbi:MAG: elongation factor P [Pyrinomonadaceae bacterium]|jgi:elongation factor P|nr:elongation factor P [Acidobacteriota bacterium]